MEGPGEALFKAQPLSFGGALAISSEGGNSYASWGRALPDSSTLELNGRTPDGHAAFCGVRGAVGRGAGGPSPVA